MAQVTYIGARGARADSALTGRASGDPTGSARGVMMDGGVYQMTRRGKGSSQLLGAEVLVEPSSVIVIISFDV